MTRYSYFSAFFVGKRTECTLPPLLKKRLVVKAKPQKVGTNAKTTVLCWVFWVTVKPIFRSDFRKDFLDFFCCRKSFFEYIQEAFDSYHNQIQSKDKTPFEN